MLAGGSVLTVTLAGNAGGLLTIDALTSAVASELRGFGLTVRNLVITAPGVSYLVPTEWLSWNYLAVVTVQTAIDADSADAIGAFVAQAFGDQVGTAPTAVSTTVGGSITPTLPGSPIEALGSPFGLLSTLHADAIGAIVIVGGLVALALVVIGWGKGRVLGVRVAA